MVEFLQFSIIDFHFINVSGEAFYLCSSSEIQRVSLAASRSLASVGTLTLAPDARPKPEVPAPVVESTATAAAATANTSAETDSQVEKQNKENERQTQGTGNN